MTILCFSVLLFIFSIIAGLLGALTGLGGGVVVIPVLVLLFHTNIHYAMGASLISVMATSSGTTAAYFRRNVKINLLSFKYLTNLKHHQITFPYWRH